MAGPDPDEVFAALVAAFPPGSYPGLVEIRRRDDEAVLMFRWPPSERLFGVPVLLTRIDLWVDPWLSGDPPAESLEEWIDSVDIWLMESVENGFLYRSRRSLVDGYIELRSPDWPVDERFYIDVVAPQDSHGWLRAPRVQSDGLDAEAAVQRRRAGSLIGWVLAYENVSTGIPYVGQATVVWDSPHVACLDYFEVVPGLPATVVLDMVRSATHAAADAGAVTVVTGVHMGGVDEAHLRIAGFHPMRDGHLEVDTTFLEEDPEAAERLHQETLAIANGWQSRGGWVSDHDPDEHHHDHG